MWGSAPAGGFTPMQTPKLYRTTFKFLPTGLDATLFHSKSLTQSEPKERSYCFFLELQHSLKSTNAEITKSRVSPHNSTLQKKNRVNNSLQKIIHSLRSEFHSILTPVEWKFTTQRVKSCPVHSIFTPKEAITDVIEWTEWFSFHREYW